MRAVKVTLNFNGEIVTGVLRVRADYLASDFDRDVRLRNLLEGNAQVISIEEIKHAD